MMPDARRLRAAARAARRRATRDIPVLMLSARAGEEARIEGLAGRRGRLPGQAVLRARAAWRASRRSSLRAEVRAIEEAHNRRLATIFTHAPGRRSRSCKGPSTSSSSPTSRYLAAASRTAHGDRQDRPRGVSRSSRTRASTSCSTPCTRPGRRSWPTRCACG